MTEGIGNVREATAIRGMARTRTSSAGRTTGLAILFVAPYVPSPLRVRPFQFIRHLSARGHRVTVLATATSKREQVDAAALARECHRVHVIPVSRARALWNCTRAAATGLPLQAAYCYSPALMRRLRDALDEIVPDGIDLVHTEHVRAALFALPLRGVPRVYDAVDSMSRLLELTAAQGPTLLTRLQARADLSRMRRFERSLVARFDRVLAASHADAHDLSGAQPVSVVPNGVDVVPSDSVPRDAATLVYHGRMAYHANVSAVLHLVREVMPIVWARRPDTRVVIVGSDPPRAVRALGRRHAGRVVVTNHVPDVRPYLERATLAVVPLRYAVGMQNKILEAMAMALPVVTTPIGSSTVPHGPVLVGSTAAEVAAHVLRVLDDEVFARRLGDEGKRHVARDHTWASAVSRLEAVYAEVVESFGRRAAVA
ncbi:MAG: glycosyltransferase [Candidatus Binatia bacterium]